MAGPDSSSVHEKYEFHDYIFAFTTEVNGKITTELEDEPEENSMTVYVNTISGKTISINCDKNQKADTVSKEVEMKTSIPRGITYLDHQGKVLHDKKTMEENNIGAEATIEMSLRLLGGMDESDMEDPSETKRENWKKRVKANRRERAKNQFSYEEK